jgi:hypothetical protein
MTAADEDDVVADGRGAGAPPHAGSRPGTFPAAIQAAQALASSSPEISGTIGVASGLAISIRLTMSARGMVCPSGQ